MNEIYQIISSKHELKKENKMLYVLVQELPVKLVKKLTGKKSGAWYEQETSGSLKGYELTMKDGNQVFIDTELDGEYALLYKLFIKEKGTGLGSRILNSYKQYIDNEGGVLMVCLVINEDFFNKFDWLCFDEYQTYEYSMKK